MKKDLEKLAWQMSRIGCLIWIILSIRQIPACFRVLLNG